MKKTLLLVAVLAISSQNAFGQTSQQLTGSFPIMDGGFEGQTTATQVGATGTNSSTASTNWTYDSASAPVTIVTSDARTGNKAAQMITAASASTSKYLQSPSVGTQAFAVSTAYTVQFYYKSSTSSPLKAAVYSGARNSGAGSVGTADTNGWIKQYWGTTTVATTGVAGEWAGVASSTVSTTTVIDDFVIYAGGLDTTAPDAPTAATYIPDNNSVYLSWTAPSTGVDGGGYIVVRYTATPGAVDLPNVNGIYAVNNTIDRTSNSGLVGTVVYTGTDTKCTDSSLSSGTYYYKIFTVDKAFNYSAELLISANLGTLGLSSLSDNNEVRVYKNNGVFVANSGNKTITNITVFDMNGRVISKQNNLNNASVSLQNLSQKKGVYIVEVTTNDNKKVSVKIIN